MSATVYTTAGGRRFHFDRACRALESGRLLNEHDCGCDEFCYHRLPTTHLPRTRSNAGAALAGFTACRVCVPPRFALPAVGETYGHEPVQHLGRHIVCRRCTDPYIFWGSRARRRIPAPMPWPCTSAAVLGLVVTDADRWNARYPVGTPVDAYPGARWDEPLRTHTRTPAWRLGHGDSVVSVDGYAGGIALTHIDPRDGA